MPYPVSMIVLQADLSLYRIPNGVRRKLKDALRKNDDWEVLAYHVRDCLGDDDTLSDTDIQEMAVSDDPAGKLLNKLDMLNSTVEDVQDFLKNCGLINLVDLLITNVKVKITEPKESQDVIKKVGEKCVMRIVVRGSPKPICQWYLNDEPLPEEIENELIIRQVGKGSEGIYRCQAVQNIQGRQEEQWSHTFSLIVKPSRPIVALGGDLKSVTLDANGDLILEFKVLAYPDPVYIFFKEGIEIQRSYCNTFKVIGVGVADAGTYYCVAENSEGKCQSAKVPVMVNEACSAPDVPEFVQKPNSPLSYALKDTVDIYYEVRCSRTVVFSCFINGRSLNDTYRVGTRTMGKYIHICNVHYEVNEEDWCQANQGPIIVLVEARTQDHCITATITIDVLIVPRQRLKARNKWALLIGNFEYALLSHLITPPQDMKGFSSALTSLGFRCMSCFNVTKPEFTTILRRFSSFCQEGDYVVFYYAGHGFYNGGTDYMIPLNARKTGIRRNEIDVQACISTTEVINQFQKNNPALIFYVHDSCRERQFVVRDSQQERVQKVAKGNLCQLNATSESYAAWEEYDSGSLLMQKVIGLASKNILVRELCSMVLKEFTHCEGSPLHSPQVPQLVIDLQYDCSIADPSAPKDQDYSGVIRRWNALSDVGGIKEQKVTVGNIEMLVRIKCEQEGYPKIISNSINVVVNITFLTSAASEERLEVTFIPSTGKPEDEVCVPVSETPIKHTIQDLQTVDGDLCVQLSFKKGDDDGECNFNLGKPSLCNIMDSENDTVMNYENQL